MTLTRYKIPRDIRICATLPKTTVGKIDKVALKAAQLGSGDVAVDCKLKSGCVSARARAGVRSAIATRKIMAR